LSEFRKCFRRERSASRFLQAVARMKWHRRIVLYMAELRCSATFLSLTSKQPLLIFCIENTLRQGMFYYVKRQKRSQG